jgi:DNA-binding protein HU-beta
MNKDQFIARIAEATGDKKTVIDIILAAAFSVIQEAVKKDGGFTVFGFGAFKLVAKPERIGRNPRTGEAITIPAHNKVVFKPSKAFTDFVN